MKTKKTHKSLHFTFILKLSYHPSSHSVIFYQLFCIELSETFFSIYFVRKTIKRTSNLLRTCWQKKKLSSESVVKVSSQIYTHTKKREADDQTIFSFFFRTLKHLDCRRASLFELVQITKTIDKNLLWTLILALNFYTITASHKRKRKMSLYMNRLKRFDRQ